MCLYLPHDYLTLFTVIDAYFYHVEAFTTDCGQFNERKGFKRGFIRCPAWSVHAFKL
jgi:hypothetical protein